MKKTIIVLAALLASVAASAELKVKQPCSDGMVLQQNTNAVVWGFAEAGQTIRVTASWDSVPVTVTTADNGIWKAYLETPAASYDSYEITVTGDGGQYVIHDVLVGEVWLASGQSNMEMPMRGFYNSPVRDAQKFASAAPARNKIRMFTEPLKQSYEPLDDCVGSWKGADQSTILDMSATAFFFAHKLSESLDVPIGIVSCAYGGARVESWVPKSQLEAWGTEDLSVERIESMEHYTRPYLAYNAMFNPIAGYTIKGFIWYQGCSNVGAHQEFVERMGWLIRHWRERFGDTTDSLPFYMVEIAPYVYKPVADQSYASLLRVEQHRVCDVIPNTGTVVTNDLVESYEKDNIHPCHKQEVGERLAAYALNRQYGFDRIACESPRALDAFTPEGCASEICVNLSNCPNGLNRWREIKGLEVCGSEGVWFPVEYAFYEWAGYLRIRSEYVFDPKQVRYGWGDYNPGNLTNVEGLPVAPFWVKIAQ